MPNYSIDQLNKKWMDAETAIKDLFAEQRSNILLVTGNHYSRKTSSYLERLKTNKAITNEAKIRLVKNHIQNITKMYVNSILNLAPSVMVAPKHERELQSQKSAELNQSVWEHIKQSTNFKEKASSYCHDFIEIGECFVKTYWDSDVGTRLPYENLVDEFGQVVQQTVVMSGALRYEKFFGFDAIIDPAAQDFDDARWIAFRKMADKEPLEIRYANDEEKLRFIKDSSKETYRVFSQYGYNTSEQNKVMIKEFYFKPCLAYPKGYYYIVTSSGILEEGELPAGEFPISYVGFDRIPTCARHQSIIKQARPYQGEINRAASKQAEHQVTLGDDKILIQAGTKLSQGGTLAGIRGVAYTGLKPEILQGRDGSQYVDYILGQIEEMYKVCGVSELYEDKETGEQDQYTQLFKSMRNKRKFSMYAEKFELFLKDICEKSLKLYKFHALPQDLVPVVGKNEYVNIPEFKNNTDNSFKIVLENVDGNLDDMIGKQLTLNNLLQYAGNQLSNQDVGEVIRNMPFLNGEQILGDLTLNYDSAVNMILALDRGELPMVDPSDDHVYMIKRLVNRMRQSDFQFLPEQIKANYMQVKQQHEEIQSQQLQEEQQASLGQIPAAGRLIGVDFYVNYDPNDMSKSRRAKLPYDSIDWLLGRLEKQGMTLDVLSQLDQQSQNEMQNMAQSQGLQQPSEGQANPQVDQNGMPIAQ